MTIPNEDTRPASAETPAPARIRVEGTALAARARIAATVAELRALHIETERDLDLAVQLDRLLEVDAEGRGTAVPVRFTAAMETRGIIMIEPAGGGKTTAIRRLLSGCAALNPEGGPARHLHVQVPSPRRSRASVSRSCGPRGSKGSRRARRRGRSGAWRVTGSAFSAWPSFGSTRRTICS